MVRGGLDEVEEECSRSSGESFLVSPPGTALGYEDVVVLRAVIVVIGTWAKSLKLN